MATHREMLRCAGKDSDRRNLKRLWKFRKLAVEALQQAQAVLGDRVRDDSASLDEHEAYKAVKEAASQGENIY